MRPGRPRAIAPKQAMLSIRLSQAMLDALDKARGGVPRSTFVRWLLEQHIEHHKEQA